ncbi:MAG: PHB depolymerase family esterase [Burkholderiaceae bacterium]|nr:PHB depolymerase family esterase [Burkholderiaceae bacterium]
MHSRRKFLATSAGLGAVLLIAANAALCAEGAPSHIKDVVAITQVFGDGQKFTAIAVEYDKDIETAKLSASTFEVKGRRVVRAYANTSASPAEQGKNGRYVIVELSLDDPDARLYGHEKMSATRKTAKAALIQRGPVFTAGGDAYAASAKAVATRRVANLVVDDFVQREYKDPKTGDLLRYNLFVPRNYDKNKSYPLVLFMHDAGATSTRTDTTLVQGLGAVAWASPSDQARHESFVLAPQYSTWVVNDKSEASSYLDTTIDLLDFVAKQYNIDRNRLYTTGQSGGAMMSIAMNIKYPNLFAASFIVAGQWDAAKVQPLVGQKQWIVVSEGDLKAYPGQNAVTAALEKGGAKVSRAVWNGRSSPAEFDAAVKKMAAEGNAVNYVALEKGSVVPPGESDDGGGNHVNTWRIAYTIDAIRDWVFAQHK